MLSSIDTENIVLKDNIINRIYLFLFQSLLFLMLVIPRTGELIKIVLIVCMVFLVLIDLVISKEILINKKILTFISIYLTYAILASFVGLIRNNPGAYGFIKVNILYPIILTLFVLYVRRFYQYEKLLRIILIASNVISIYSILLFLVNIGYWPEALFIDFDVTSNVGIHDGYVHLTNTNLSMLIFSAPLCTYLIIKNYNSLVISKRFLLLTGLLLIVASLLSGRRILWIAILISIMLLVINKLLKFSLKNLLLIVFSLILLILIFNILQEHGYLSIDGIIERFNGAFKYNEENVRFEQAIALWEGFKSYPILGSGAGVGVENFVRSNSAPWNYELSYNLILYNSGLIGFILYATCHIYLLFMLWNRSRKSKDVIAGALFLSYVIVLFANATNPYFSSSFDFLWFIFIPLMYINISSVYINNKGIK